VDVHFSYSGQHFRWDAEKARFNFEKHGIRFEQAAQVFFDPLVRLVDASAEDEAREAALRLTEDWTLLFVVHLVRENNAIRLISARQATKAERSVYEND
jgi:uncharacterized DUF497 family protein